MSASVAEFLSIGEACDAQLISYPDITESLAITAVESFEAAGTISNIPDNYILMSSEINEAIAMSNALNETVLMK